MRMRAAVFAVTTLLVLSCTSAAESGGGTRPTVDTSPAPSQHDDPQVRSYPPRLPERPASSVVRLADQLDVAARTLRDPDAGRTRQRRAGEFQQLAVRELAMESPRRTGRVLERLDRRTALVTRDGVRAARALLSMTSPQRRLPRWRIVAPPPPGRLLGHYRLAQHRLGVHWSYLAAIHLVETRMGRIRGTSTAGARGPMQFLPTTWDLYGAGGDINDPRDAILAAARLLRANGAPREMAGALWHYNPSDRYVRAVLAYARSMRRSASAYLGYWHWRVLYRHQRGTVVLPVGYPRKPATPLPGG